MWYRILLLFIDKLNEKFHLFSKTVEICGFSDNPVQSNHYFYRVNNLLEEIRNKGNNMTLFFVIEISLDIRVKDSGLPLQRYED